jgi:hypothetical protein
VLGVQLSLQNSDLEFIEIAGAGLLFQAFAIEDLDLPAAGMNEPGRLPLGGVPAECIECWALVPPFGATMP